MSTIVTTTSIRRPPGDVFAYVTAPGNWPRWHPSSIAVRGTVDRSMAVGESCVEDFIVAGRRGSCEWTCRESIPGARWVIDTESRGGSATITYALRGDGQDGALFERTLSYRMPNVFLAFLDVLAIRRRITRESEEALRRLKRTLEAGDGSSAPSPGGSTGRASGYWSAFISTARFAALAGGILLSMARNGKRGEVVAAEKSLPELVQVLSNDVATLVRQEVQLARAELAEAGKSFALSAGLFGATAIFGVAAFVALTVALVAALSVKLPLWEAGVIITAIYVLAGAVTALIGRFVLKKATSSFLGRTVQSVKEDVDAIREGVRRGR